MSATDVHVGGSYHSVQHHHTLTQSHGCSVEALPTDRSYVAVGNYELNEQSKQKHGGVTLYKIEPATASSEPATTSKHALRQLQHVASSAVLDLKWQPTATTPALGAAGEDGCLCLYTLDQLDGNLSESCRISASPNPTAAAAAAAALCLSLAWAPDTGHVATSNSDGTVSIIDPATQQLVGHWLAHDLEAWICTYDSHSPNVLYTGADDTKLKQWDVRTQPAELSSTAMQQPAAINTSHQAGVCALQTSIHTPYQLATGSYDEYLRIFDTRALRRPVMEQKLGGGVWRVKYHPVHPNRLVCACMHNGFQVVELQDTSIDVTATYMEHTSLAYGVDWCQSFSETQDLIASCSFYDNQVHLWSTVND